MGIQINGQTDTISATDGSLTVSGADLTNPININVSGVSTFGNTVVGGGTTQLIVTGNARITGILTIGTSSITLDGSNNQVNVGTGVTLHHTNGVQVGDNNLHSTVLTVNQINASGVVTATTFSGSLTGNVTGNLTGNVNSSGVSTVTTISGTTATYTTFNGDVTGNVNSSGVSTFSSGIVVAAGSTVAPSISPTGDSNTGIFFPSADTIAFGEGGSEAARIDSSGRFGLGTTTPGRKLVVAGDLNTVVAVEGSTSGTSNLFLGDTADEDVCALGYNHQTNSLGITVNASASPAVTIDSSGRLLVGTTSVSHGLSGSIVNRTAGTSSPGTYFRGGTWSHFAIGGEPAYVLSSNINASGNVTASETARGGIGYEYVNSSEPTRLVIGTVVASSVPCPVTFWSEGTERMRIQQNGFIKAANNGSYLNTTDAVHRFESDNASNPFFVLRSQNANYGGEGLQIRVNRAANNGYWFLAGQSSDGGDNEFVLKGDGNAYADLSWTGGGADYAEYFEWSDANPNEEDRRGISVVLDGEKIREAVAGEDPIGVISGNPSVVGDAAWNKWSGKYLRDEFGSYLLNENGDRQLNPAYDPAQEYIPREQRPEWDCVGLMGKLRIRKGQVTGSRWIKMRDISDSVEEWLVR